MTRTQTNRRHMTDHGAGPPAETTPYRADPYQRRSHDTDEDLGTDSDPPSGRPDRTPPSPRRSDQRVRESILTTDMFGCEAAGQLPWPGFDTLQAEYTAPTPMAAARDPVRGMRRGCRYSRSPDSPDGHLPSPASSPLHREDRHCGGQLRRTCRRGQGIRGRGPSHPR
jgi:hypothetical protein